MPLEELYTRVLTPFLEWLGARWQEGEAAVWEEHLLTSAVRTAIDALYPRVLAAKALVEPVPVTVAFFCPPEETHDLGLRMLVDRFDLRGFRTVYVGALTPFEQMVDCAREMGADVVCLSASTHFQRTVLREGVNRLRADLPGVRIVVGGPAFARSATAGATCWLGLSTSFWTSWRRRRVPKAPAATKPPAIRRAAMLELRIARRFLWRSKGQSLLIVLGIAVGIAVQVFVGSLITSLQDSLVETTVGSSSQVTVKPAEGDASLTFSSDMRSQVEADPRVTAVAPVQVLSALIALGDSGSPVVAKGGTFADLDSIYKLSDSLIAGQASLTGGNILLGKELVEANGLVPGDTVELVLADGSRLTSTLEGVFDLGTQAVNQQSVFMGLEQASEALGRPSDEVSAVEMQIDDVFASQEVAAEISAEFPDVEVTDWQETNADLLSALQSQSTSSIMIQVFVIVAVMLGIASTLAISAVQKTRQIGILKALGMRDARTGLVFLYQAGILGVVGTVLGIAVSLALIEVFSAIAAQGDSGLFPIEPQPGFILISAAIGIGVALVSAIIPYRRTSRLDPIEVIQGA